MRDQALANVRSRFQAYEQLARQISDEQLEQNLPIAKNKSIAEHLWCVVGARESYARALTSGGWDGFSCSLQDSARASFIDALITSAKAFERAVAHIAGWSAAQDKLLLDLLEHEVMHEGQLIRHVYALGGTLPESWKWA